MINNDIDPNYVIEQFSKGIDIYIYINLSSVNSKTFTNTHHMIIRLKCGITKPKSLLGVSTMEPTIAKQSLSNPQWKDAIDQEYDALVKNHTWSLVPKLPH